MACGNSIKWGIERRMTEDEREALVMAMSHFIDIMEIRENGDYFAARRAAEKWRKDLVMLMRADTQKFSMRGDDTEIEDEEGI